MKDDIIRRRIYRVKIFCTMAARLVPQQTSKSQFLAYFHCLILCQSRGNRHYEFQIMSLQMKCLVKPWKCYIAKKHINHVVDLAALTGAGVVALGHFVAAAHLSCSSSAHKDCKCIAMFGYQHVVHQWAVRWTEVADQPDESYFCSYCEEPCNGSFLGGSPIWCCLWCQRLVHVDCHANMSNETGDTCDLGPFKRLILSPLYVKELNRTLPGRTVEFYHTRSQ